MARVDFYVLSQAGRSAQLHFACRLAEKVYRLANTVQLFTESEQEARQLDELLWTFRDGSFVPHELVSNEDDLVESPVLISTRENLAQKPDLLINLTWSLPASAGTLPRIAELVTSDDDARAAGRRRFADYRDQGHELETHTV